MFEKFGEFDSAEELNRAAAGQKAEGDIEALIALAVENGIDKEDAQDYADGCMDELCNPLMAALGKIEVESKALKIEGILLDWKGILMQNCAEDEAFCKAVRKKGKSLRDCMAALIKYSFENKVQISDEIVNATKVLHNGKLEQMRKPLYLGVPNIAETKKITREYYLS